MNDATLREIMRRDDRFLGRAMKIRFFPIAPDRAEGTRIYDVNGRSYLDFTASWAVANVGYGHQRVKESLIRQWERLSCCSLTSVFQATSISLAERLVELVPGDFAKKVWFGLSGSDANDCVAKMLPMASGRPRMLSFMGAYHGQTMGSLSLSGHAAQAKFLGLPNVVKVPYPYCYRCPFGKDPGGCGLFCLAFIEDYVFKTICPPEDTAAVIVEAVQSDGGDVVPPAGYLQALEALCRKHGIYLVLDEVKIGFGRTGKFFGFQHEGVVPDAVVMGKPMAGGFPMSAVVARQEILDAGTATHLFTVAGHPVGCAAGLATIDAVLDERLVENAALVGAFLKEGLQELKQRHSLIGDVRGQGLILGVELVKDPGSKQPAAREAAKVVYRAFELGLLVYYVGIQSNVLELTPPLTLTKEEAEEGLAILDRALAEVAEGRVDDEKIKEFAGW